MIFTLIISYSGGMGYFMVGNSILDMSALNSKLQSKGYPTFSNNFISLGGGGHGIVGKFTVGGEGHGFLGDEVSRENYTVSIGGGYGFFNLGYILYQGKSIIIYPIIGFGGGALTLGVIDRSSSSSFDDALDNPKGKSELTTGGFLMNLALSSDYLFSFSSDKIGGMLIGIRIGYVFSPLKSGWEMNGKDISGPNVNFSGPYVKLLIGGGNYGK